MSCFSSSMLIIRVVADVLLLEYLITSI
jgi:hypothetical protein